MTTIIIGDPLWTIPALVVAVISVALVWWAYRRARVGSGVSLAPYLKVIVLILLAVCLTEPLWSGLRARPGSNLFLILADNSASLEIEDADSSETRGSQLRKLLTERKDDKQPEWLTRLSQDFDVRRMLFDRRIDAVEDFSGLTFTGDASSLASAFQLIKDRYQDRPVGGVLLLSDGNATDLVDGQFDLTGLPPIYPVRLSDSDVKHDLAITSLAVSQTPFEDAPVTIQADVSAHGLDEEDVTAVLLDGKDAVVKQETARIEDGAVTFRFRIRPTKRGVTFYRLKVKCDEEFEEATARNNERVIAVDRGSRPRRVLYVGGRPNWEFKFLRRALKSDEKVDLVGLIRVAKREARFDWRGHAGEEKNSLFRGFENEGDAQAEEFDEPVLVRLNTRDESELRSGFPKKAEELFAFDAVIIDALEARFFDQDQLALLKRFVSERGGGLLMLGGEGAFDHGGYTRTPVGDVLPVYGDAAGKASSTTRYRLSLTREGWLQPWIRLRNDETGERQRIAAMPEFHTLNHVRGLKPGASVLANVEDGSGNRRPALVGQRFGRGKTGAVLIGDLWRWQLRREADAENDLAKAWRQMIRWLVADVPEQVDLELKSSEHGKTVVIRTRDESFLPLENADVKVTITPPDGKPITLDGESSLDDAGTYKVEYPSRAAGPYSVSVDVTDGDGGKAGSAATGWAENPDAEEFRNVAVNSEFLEELARETGGEVVEAGDIERFVAGLPSRSHPVSEKWTAPLWDEPWVFALMFGLLIGEWGLRRFRGLP